MSQWGDGRDPEWGSRPSRRPADRPSPEVPPIEAPPSEPSPAERLSAERLSGDEDTAPAQRVDWVGVVAVVAGFLGIVVFGILLALVAGILGAIAGQRAREAGRSLELAYLAFILAGVDGVVWIVLHLLFEIPIQVG